MSITSVWPTSTNNVADHPEETKEAAAVASGYSSYNSYYRAKQKMER